MEIQPDLLPADVRSCGFLIFRDSPSPAFLLMKHADRWDLPKGHVDEGETDIQCALRELVEETGIAEQQVELFPEFRFVYQYRIVKDRGKPVNKLKELVVFAGRLLRPVSIVVTEHIGYEWFEWKPPHSIQQRTIDPVLAYAAGYLSQHPSPQIQSS